MSKTKTASASVRLAAMARRVRGPTVVSIISHSQQPAWSPLRDPAASPAATQAAIKMSGHITLASELIFPSCRNSIIRSRALHGRAPRKARAALRKENVGGGAAQRGLRRLHRPRLRACSPDLCCLFGELRLRQAGRIALQSSHLHLQGAEMHTSTRNRNMAERRVLMRENALFKHTRSKIKIERCSDVNMEFSYG